MSISGAGADEGRSRGEATLRGRQSPARPGMAPGVRGLVVTGQTEGRAYMAAVKKTVRKASARRVRIPREVLGTFKADIRLPPDIFPWGIVIDRRWLGKELSDAIGTKWEIYAVPKKR